MSRKCTLAASVSCSKEAYFSKTELNVLDTDLFTFPDPITFEAF